MHWKQAIAFLDGKCTEYTTDKGKKPNNGYARGYVMPSGLQLAVETTSDSEQTNIWIEDCGPPPIPSHFQLYNKDKSRTSALSSVSPRLSGPGYGKPPKRAYKILVKSSQEIEALYSWYSSLDGSILNQSRNTEEEPVPGNKMNPISNKLNLILYGPPGTGKTYKTAEIAVEICDDKSGLPRDKLMIRYAELQREGRISFVTFHQSYGYEEFVEGLRPEIIDGQVSYRVRPGIFRVACDAARIQTLIKPGISGAPLKQRTIYKMSLGRSGTTEGKQVLQDCLENGYVVLGWGDDVDFSECNTLDAIRAKLEEDNPNAEKPESHARFVNLLKMEVQIGDIIIVSHGNKAFHAIGEITGAYEYLELPAAGTFYQMRPVRWLAVYDIPKPVSDIYENNFMMSALYKLKNADLKFDVLESMVKAMPDKPVQNHVIIIDEINRANISKVFGELITLLEHDKREGLENSLMVKLPYSGTSFSVPSNLYVIGTMNTADRSIALLDTALRRRFDFEELQPDYRALPEGPIEGVELRPMLRTINERIEFLYDRDHTIGHAYFIDIKTLNDLDSVFRRKLIPLLQEYFYENWSKIQLVLNDINGRFIETETSLPIGLESIGDGFEPRSRYNLKSDMFDVAAYQSIYK